MSRRDLRGLRVICTGASSGIGAALCTQLAQRGAQLVLNARRADRLQELADRIDPSSSSVRWVDGDITQDAIRRAILAEAQTSWQGIDAIINCAGIGSISPFMESSEDVLRRVMEVNFFAPVELTRLALPILQQGHHPILVNIGSVLGHRAVPRKSEYCASKFALHGFSDALRAELAAMHIDLLLVSPSTTHSEFFDHVLNGEATTDARQRRGMTPERVARLVIQAMIQGRHEIILSSGGKLLVWLDRLCPPLMNRILAKYG